MRVHLIVPLVLCLAACSKPPTPTAPPAKQQPADPAAAYVKEAMQLAAHDLKDPEATRFREVKVYHLGIDMSVCGELNSKNSYGAYTGYHPFLWATADHVAIVHDATNAVFYTPIERLWCRNSTKTPMDEDPAIINRLTASPTS